LSEDIVERLPVRYAALACVIASGLLISGPGLLASADPGGGGNGSNASGGDPQSTDNGATPKGLLSALSTLPGLHWLSQGPAATAPAIGSVAPPLMNLPILPPPGTAPSGPNLVPAFMLPNPDNPHGVAVTRTPGAQQPPAGVDSQPAEGRIAPLSQGPLSQEQRQGANTSPTISVVAPATSGVPVGPTDTINNPLPGAAPFNVNKPVLPQVLPPLLVLLLTAIANHVPLAGLVITPLMNATLPPLLAGFFTPGQSGSPVPILLPGAGLPAMMPSVLSLAGLLPLSGPPPADVAPMGMDAPEAPAAGPTPPVNEPAPPLTSPDNGVSALDDPVAFRAGYSDYLRNAGMAQITAIAVPGALAILLLWLGGGFIGYRQARAGHIIRAEGITRFLH
jgi:hypothetical protein